MDTNPYKWGKTMEDLVKPTGQHLQIPLLDKEKKTLFIEAAKYHPVALVSNSAVFTVTKGVDYCANKVDREQPPDNRIEEQFHRTVVSSGSLDPELDLWILESKPFM
jgi:hypothetical protein